MGPQGIQKVQPKGGDVMRRTSIALSAIFALILGVLGVANATFATAGGTDMPVPPTTVTVTASSDTDVSTHVSEITQVATGYTEVMNVSASGTPRSQQRVCVTIKKAKVTYKWHGLKIRVGMTYWTDYYTASGRHVWHTKKVVVGDKFCVVGKVVRRTACHNQAVFKKVAPGPVIANIKVVLRFTLKATASATATSNATATAHAVCDGGPGGSKAEAYGSGSGTGTATASAVVVASSYAAVAAKARGVAVNLSISLKEKVSLKAIADAKSEATAKASAKAVCSYAPPPPPPVNHPPTVVIQNAPQHIIVNGIIQLCAMANDPDGDSLLWTFSAKYSTVGNPYTPNPSAPYVRCAQITAPDSPHPDEVITVTVSDGESSATAETPPFPIAPSPGF